MESTSKEAKSDFTSGTNPHQTKNQQEFLDREGSPDSPPPFPDNTTQHGNKRNETAFTLEVTIKKETAFEKKKDGTGDSLFSHIVVLWIYMWTWIVKVHKLYMYSIDLSYTNDFEKF